MSTKAEEFIKSYKIMWKYVVANYFCKTAPPQTFDWVLNTALHDTVKKSIHFKVFPNLCKTFCVFILIMYIIYFVAKIRKTCYRNK